MKLTAAQIETQRRKVERARRKEGAALAVAVKVSERIAAIDAEADRRKAKLYLKMDAHKEAVAATAAALATLAWMEAQPE